MSFRQDGSNPVKTVWNFFTSVKLTVVVLLSLAITSIIGTVIPQNKTPMEYFQAFGEAWYRLFDLLNIFDMYHSWWFLALLILLTLNIIACSFDRLPGTWKIVFIKKPIFNIDRFRKLTHQESFSVSGKNNPLKDSFEKFLRKHFGYCRVENTDKGVAIFGERGRWTRLGPYIVHLSIILLLFGGIIGSIFGFEGDVVVPEGSSVNQIRLRGSAEIISLPFDIQCNDFQISFYDTGAPKEYRSNLTLVENGKELITKDIIVNDPLRYGGINIYQSSYQPISPSKAIIGFTGAASKMDYRIEMGLGDSVELPEGLGSFTLKRFIPQADFRGHPIGEAFEGVLTPSGKPPMTITLPLRFPSFDRMRKGRVFIHVEEYEKAFATGLQVTKDPGVPVVYTGFVIMIIGCLVTFFVCHQRICIEIIESDAKTNVVVAGTANKGKLGMQQKVTNLSEALKKLA